MNLFRNHVSILLLLLLDSHREEIVPNTQEIHTVRGVGLLATKCGVVDPDCLCIRVYNNEMKPPRPASIEEAGRLVCCSCHNCNI